MLLSNNAVAKEEIRCKE